MAQELAGRVAVVTGASGGLGEHFARLLAGAGASVALAARRVDRIEGLAQDLRAKGGKAMAVKLDVTDVDAIGPALDQIEAELGPISILVNNAGVDGAGAALDVTPQEWDNTFNVNVRATFFGAREGARRMIASGEAERGFARILNVASVASFTVLPGLSAYNASKASVAMITKSLAREWARYGIAVNAICPGYIETDINADWFATDGGKAQIKKFPRRRLMEATDLDAISLTLCGPAARAITGTLITIDDGQSLPGGG